MGQCRCRIIKLHLLDLNATTACDYRSSATVDAALRSAIWSFGMDALIVREMPYFSIWNEKGHRNIGKIRLISTRPRVLFSDARRMSSYRRSLTTRKWWNIWHAKKSCPHCPRVTSELGTTNVSQL